jgi:predicted phage baseplate assembly protein
VSDWIQSVRNPLPAVGGRDPEPVDVARERAPHAFRARPLRAVTAADWVRFASELPDVQSAFAHLRWTGSWYAVVVALDPRSPADLVTGPDGRILLEPGFEQRTRARLERFRLAGYDLELLAPTFVPLELEVEVCVAPGQFRSDVAAAVTRALSARRLEDGRLGLFHADNLTFGRPVHLSRVYAAVEAVPGVDTAVVRTFRRFGREDADELASGVLRIAPGEIAQLDNDPSFLEHGILRVVAQGGKA